MLEEFISNQQKITKSIEFPVKRSFYNSINLDYRLIEIIAAPGTGKTTLALQYYKEKCNIRESFFSGTMHGYLKIFNSDIADFLVYDRDLQSYEIEIGGKRKGKKQIHNIENSYIFKDDIESGFGNTIPLYCAGFVR